MAKWQNRRKYNTSKAKIEYDGHTFGSRKEMNRYIELKALLAEGKIADLELQKPYVLIPAQREPDIIGKRGGVKKGKTIERAIIYVADFVYNDLTSGEIIVEDVKGYMGKDSAGIKVYLMKKKMLLYFYGIRIKEI